MPQIKSKSLRPELNDFIECPTARAEDRLHWSWVFNQRQPVTRDADGPAGNVLRHIRRQESHHRGDALWPTRPSRHGRGLADPTLSANLAGRFGDGRGHARIS